MIPLNVGQCSVVARWSPVTTGHSIDARQHRDAVLRVAGHAGKAALWCESARVYIDPQEGGHETGGVSQRRGHE